MHPTSIYGDLCKYMHYSSNFPRNKGKCDYDEANGGISIRQIAKSKFYKNQPIATLYHRLENCAILVGKIRFKVAGWMKSGNFRVFND